MSSKRGATSWPTKQSKSNFILAEGDATIKSIPRPKALPYPRIECSQITEIKNLCNRLRPRHVLKASNFSMDLDIWGYIRDYYQSDLFSILKKLRHLSSFTLKSSSNSYFDPKSLFKFLKEAKSVWSVAKFRIEILDNPYFSDREVRIFGSYLKQFQYIEVLTLHLSNCLRITEKSINTIASCLKTMKPLLVLDILFIPFEQINETQFESCKTNFDVSKPCKPITDDTIKDLCLGIKRASIPSALKLTFPDSNLITDQTILVLCKNLEDTPSLSAIKLDFSDSSNLTDMSILGLSSTVTGFTSLSCLDLNFSNCHGICDQSLNSLYSSFAHLTSLSSLILSFMHCDGVTDITITSLSSSLTYILNLLTLNLDLSCCNNITSTGIKALSSGLKHPYLSSLSLNFSNCRNITDQDFVTLFSGIEQLTVLEEVDLNFQSSQISDQGIENITASLSPSVSILNLNLSSCEGITDRGIVGLFVNLQRFSSISALALNFSFCARITAIGFKDALLGLKYLKSLIRLNLKCISCRNFSDESIVKMCLSFEHLTSLVHLNLNLSFCPKLTSLSVEKLSVYLSKLSLMTELYISFMECPKVSFEDCRTWVGRLKNTPLRTTLNLRFTDKSLLIKHKVIYERRRGIFF